MKSPKDAAHAVDNMHNGILGNRFVEVFETISQEKVLTLTEFVMQKCIARRVKICNA